MLKQSHIYRWCIGLATLAVCLVGLGACAGSSSSAGGRGAFCQGGQTEIAYAGPMSGSEANYGEEQYNGLKLAVAAVNAQGGFTSGGLKGCKLKISGPYDDRSDPATGASIARQLSTDPHLLAYFGNVDSGVTLAALPILARAGIPVINSYSSNPKITSLGYKNIFRVILNDNTQGSAIADLLVKNFGKKKLAALWPDDVFGQGISDAFIKEAQKLGTPVAVRYSYPSNATDFSVAVSRLGGANADGVALLGVYTGDAIAVKQLAAAGITPSKATMIGNASDNTDQFVSIAGTSAANGVYLVGIWNPGNANQAGQAFTADFQKTYNAAPAEDAATAYDAVMVLKRAVESGGTDRSSLIDALHKITPSNPYQGITGKIGFDSTGQDAAAVPTLLQVQNGKIVAAHAP